MFTSVEHSFCFMVSKKRCVPGVSTGSGPVQHLAYWLPVKESSRYSGPWVIHQWSLGAGSRQTSGLVFPVTKPSPLPFLLSTGSSRRKQNPRLCLKSENYFMTKYTLMDSAFHFSLAEFNSNIFLCLSNEWPFLWVEGKFAYPIQTWKKLFLFISKTQ